MEDAYLGKPKAKLASGDGDHENDGGHENRSQEEDINLEKGRLLFAGPCEFVIAGADIAQVPDTSYPEVAFVGRSNVGKSSLVNAMTGRKTLARTSNTPGRTQQLIFFNLADRLMLVDLPGYGYAEAPKKAVKTWTGLTKAYMKGRPQLIRVFVLIDARRGIKPVDEAMMAELDTAAVSYQIVLTKIDKISLQEIKSCLEKTQDILSKHPAAHPQIFLTSSLKGTGIAQLRAAIAAQIETLGYE